MADLSVGHVALSLVDLPPEAAASPEAAVRFLVTHLAGEGLVPDGQVDRVVGEVLHRESVGTTAVGGGLALPHARSGAVARLAGVCGRSEVPVNWPGAPDHEPVRQVCLLVSPAGEPEQLLRALEEVATWHHVPLAECSPLARFR